MKIIIVKKMSYKINELIIHWVVKIMVKMIQVLNNYSSGHDLNIVLGDETE